MDDFGLALFIVLLVAIGVLPLLLIALGIIRRHKSNGPTLYMVGAGLFSLFLAAVVSVVFESLLDINDTKFFSWVILIPLLFAFYRLFKYITAEYGEKRKYISHCYRLIRQAEYTNLPSCEEFLIGTITKHLAETPETNIPRPSKRAAETAVYRLSLSLVDSDKFRTSDGLTPQGKQFLHICRYCLDYFLDIGYITDEEKMEQAEYLNECESHNDRYIFGIYP